MRLLCHESEFLFLKYFHKEIHMVSFRLIVAMVLVVFPSQVFHREKFLVELLVFALINSSEENVENS